MNFKEFSSLWFCLFRSEPYVTTLLKMHVKTSYSCHELFGFDIMLDENLKPWILEVNISPRWHTHTQTRLHTQTHWTVISFQPPFQFGPGCFHQRSDDQRSVEPSRLQGSCERRRDVLQQQCLQLNEQVKRWYCYSSAATGVLWLK